MKQFIVLLAAVPILLLFLLQFSLEQENSIKIAIITDTVYAAKEQAKQNGGFDKESLRKQLADKLGVDPSDISIEAPDMYTVRRIEPDGSRGVIHYKVLVPMDNISAGDRYFGLKNERRYAYVIESSAPSEYLGGQP